MIVSTTIGGLAVDLILIEPDWTPGVSLEVGIAVDSAEGSTGKEMRAAEHLHPRFRMSYVPDWQQTDSEDIITMRATIGTKRVAIPVYPDQRTAIADDFLLTGAHYVTWDGNGNYSVDADTYDNVAPLAFGFLESPEYQARTEKIGQTTLSFFEDCPYSHRLKIVNGTTDRDFDLEPDWTQVSEFLKSPLDFAEIGQGRERSIENREAVFRYEMTANFTSLGYTEIAYLLSFWYQSKGRLHTFNVPAWFQPSAATAETPNAYRARFRGEILRLNFITPHVAKTQLGFVQMPWELNSSGVEHVTDWLFEDPTQWLGEDANIVLMDTPGGITGMPDRVCRIHPADTVTNRALTTPSIDGVENDVVIISAMVADSATVASGREPLLGIIVFNGGGGTVADVLMTAPSAGSITTAGQELEYQYTLPATAATYRAKLVMPHANGTADAAAYAYFGDVSVIHYTAAATTLSETPVQAPRCYAFDFAYEVPGKANQRFIDWERATTIAGNTHEPYRMTVESLAMGTRLFNEEARVSYSHESDNPLMEFVIGGMERLVTLTLKEGNPNRPDSFRTVFVGKLKTLKGKGRSLVATFSAFGGIFDKRLPGFVIQSGCNYLLGDANCKVNLAALEATGTAASTDLSEGDTKLLVHTMSGTLTTINDPDGNPGDRFAGGYLSVGTGDNYQVRFIRKTTIGAGTDRTFTVNRPLDGTKLDASDGNVSVFPGCGGSSWECSGFWSNYVNFGGHPFVPERLEAVQGETPSVGK